MKEEINIEEYIKENTITDRDKMRKALCAPTSMPDEFLGKQLKPIGIAKFKGDKLQIPAWSLNSHFDIGKSYPIYDGEGMFTISDKTGEGMKLYSNTWKINFF